MKKNAYLDYAAAVPPTTYALRAFESAVRHFGNPSAAHTHGRAAKDLLEKARASIAHAAGAKPEALIFTSGATEANAIAIRGHVRAKLSAGARPEELHLLYVEGAHASVRETMEALKGEGVAVNAVPLKHGDIDTGALAELVRKETTLVSIEAISSETGARFDLKSVRQTLDQMSKERKIFLHIDACQLPLVESFERTRLAADLLSLDAQKVGGVRGIGCLIFAPNVPLHAVIEGGGQERGLRSGTESPALACAFAKALAEAAAARESFAKRAAAMREALKESLLASIPHVVVNEGKKNAPHILNISVIGRDTDYLAALLDERGYSVSTRSACETDSVDGSRAVRALTGDQARASSTLRISWGSDTKKSELSGFVKALDEAVSFVDRNPL